MKMPPLLLTTAVLFWGWQTDAWAVAVPVAIVLAAPRVLPLRWDFANAQFFRVADFCTVLLVLLAGYLFVTYGNPRAIILVFQWLPLAMLPLALAHAYSTRAELDLSVLLWTLRRNPPQSPVRFDPSFPYLAIWVLAASTANARGDAFLGGIALLAAWPLALLRPRSFPAMRWVLAFSCALAIGYGVQFALHEFQLWLEDAAPDWIAGTGARTNPYRSMTDIGHIGELKQSDAIVLRVIHEAGAKPPRLLHRASYNTYAAASWIAHGAAFSAVSPSARSEDWVIAPGATATERILVHEFSPQVNPVLSLPAGTVAVERLQARRFTRNLLGAVQVERDPGFFRYVAAFTPEHSVDAVPAAEDLRVTRTEREVFAQLAIDLAVAGLPAAAAVERTRRHFRDNFQYATFQTKPAGEKSPLIDFMQRTRAGHCEYFATATVLLLRSAGVPARYATGFAVQEYSNLEHAWIVRQRHAHAWVRAYVDGGWIDVDTTPPEWFVVETEAAPAWSRVRDVGSWLRFRAARAWGGSDSYAVPLVALLLSPFAAWLAWRLYRSRSIVRSAAASASGARGAWPGTDSELYLIEKRLAATGWGRRPHETVTDWVERLCTDAPFDASALRDIVKIHCRYRFDPAGIAEADRARLKQAASTWLAHNIAGQH